MIQERLAADAGDDSQDWLVAYGDLVTNLLGFFVILFSMSTLAQHRFEQVRQGFNANTESRLSRLEEAVEREFARARDVRTVLDTEGLEVTFGNNLVFESASANVSEEGRRRLRRLAELLQQADAELQSDIVVQGHTDDQPIRSQRFASNWELSSQRSINVARQLLAAGLAKSRISTQAFADTRPPEEVGRARAKMRRVVVRIK